MKITVRVAVDTGDDTAPADVEVLAIDREDLAIDTAGLHLAEARELLAAVQDVLVTAQVTSALDQYRRCPECERTFRRKDTKKIHLTTLFGAVDVDSPRYLSCPCRVQDSATFSPLAAVLTGHTTPETAYIQARFAAVMSYGQAAALLGEVFPLGRTLHAARVREQVHRVAARLEDELGPEDTAGFRCCPRDLEELPVPELPLVVGLDGGYVHSAEQTSRSDGWFEVIAGKSIPSGGERAAKCFAFVQTIETKPRRRLHEVLHSQGVQANQAVIFLTDGGEDI
ncbi:MAG: ISKra4 family transposase, partial [Streptosporangiaceae bacterium]